MSETCKCGEMSDMGNHYVKYLDGSYHTRSACGPVVPADYAPETEALGRENAALRSQVADLTQERDAYADRWREVTKACDAALARAEEAERETQRVREAGEAHHQHIVGRYRDSLAAAERERDALRGEVERRTDCHAGPGTTEPACGRCCTCLNRRVEALEEERDRYHAAARVVIEGLASKERPTCECGKPATCVGAYEREENLGVACDECCGHGNEDGWCVPLAAPLAQAQEPCGEHGHSFTECNELYLAEQAGPLCAASGAPAAACGCDVCAPAPETKETPRDP